MLLRAAVLPVFAKRDWSGSITQLIHPRMSIFVEMTIERAGRNRLVGPTLRLCQPRTASRAWRSAVLVCHRTRCRLLLPLADPRQHGTALCEREKSCVVSISCARSRSPARMEVWNSARKPNVAINGRKSPSSWPYLEYGNVDRSRRVPPMHCGPGHRAACRRPPQTP